MDYQKRLGNYKTNKNKWIFKNLKIQYIKYVLVKINNILGIKQKWVIKIKEI